MCQGRDLCEVLDEALEMGRLIVGKQFDLRGRNCMRTNTRIGRFGKSVADRLGISYALGGALGRWLHLLRFKRA